MSVTRLFRWLCQLKMINAPKKSLVNLASVFNIKADNFVLSNWGLQYDWFRFLKENLTKRKMYVVNQIKWIISYLIYIYLFTFDMKIAGCLDIKYKHLEN